MSDETSTTYDFDFSIWVADLTVEEREELGSSIADLLVALDRDWNLSSQVSDA